MRQTRITPKSKAPKSSALDDQLVEHLKQAEHHLISAIELFARKHPPKRRPEYLERLNRHQIGVTGLLREELVRIRGPQRPKGN